MKKTLLAVALFLGFTATGIAQTEYIVVEDHVDMIGTVLLKDSIGANVNVYSIREERTGEILTSLPTPEQIGLNDRVRIEYGNDNSKGGCGTCGIKVFRILGKA